MSTRSHVGRIAVVAAALFVLVLLVRPRAPGGGALETADEAGRAAVPAPRAPARPVHPALDPAMLSSAALREALERYQRDSVYPPGSHRWSEETAGENLPWNRPFPVELPLDDRPGRETVSRFAADRHHVEYGAALTSTIEVWPAARPAERLPVSFRSATVEAAAIGRTGISLTYRDDGRDGDAVAGDHVYTNRIVPSAEDELAGAALRVRLQVDIEAGGVNRLLYLDFTYAPRPLLDLVAVDTAARGGSLAIDLDLRVHAPGHYQFFADVLAADGATPIGWITPHWTELAKGSSRVELSLFGKVLRDRGIPGPYVIANLRAVRRAGEVDEGAWWSDPRSFTTDRFALDDFSPEPWDGAERRDTIAALQASIAEQEAAERGAGQP